MDFHTDARPPHVHPPPYSRKPNHWTPTVDGVREIEKELCHHHNEDWVPKCEDAPVDNLIGGWEGEGGGNGIS